MNERRYSDIVSGSGKFILQYLPGICLAFAAIYVQAFLPDHVQSHVSKGHRIPSQSCCAGR